MGRCLAFNFGPQELKAKLKDVKYFVYSPDYESAGYCGPQHFYATLDISQTAPETVIRELETLAKHSRFSSIKKKDYLYLRLESLEAYGAITENQVEDVKLVDRKLSQLGLKPFAVERYQDVVFGENHLLAKELSKSFKAPGAFFVPKQMDWFVGRSFEEAQALFDGSFKK